MVKVRIAEGIKEKMQQMQEDNKQQMDMEKLATHQQIKHTKDKYKKKIKKVGRNILLYRSMKIMKAFRLIITNLILSFKIRIKNVNI